ncbi:MAG TPA: VCBS repeat-containing protein, partial [Polyangiaceae bacterium]|nr:VCBS repeat-containing protein [Polyangiaceae bacterium]
MKPWKFAIACALPALVGCSTFPVIEANECGNAVIEANEACDTFADTAAGEVCRPPGTVDECQFDCHLNSDGTRARCPAGRGCALDGICRERVDGQFDPPINFSSDAAELVSSADFDGDGRSEVIGTEPLDQFRQGRFRLHYFDVDSKLVETRAFPRIATPPVARDVNHDGKSDLVFSNFRIGLVPGRADRQLIPASFTSYVIDGSDVRMVGVYGDIVDGSSPLAVVARLYGGDGIYTPDYVDRELKPRALLPAPLQQLVNPPIAANLVDGPDSPCSEVVVAYRGATSFSAYDLCTPGVPSAVAREIEWRDQALEQTVQVPVGLTIDAGPLIADMNGDGHLDVVIGAGGHPYVAYGDGQQLAPVATNLHLDVVIKEELVGFDSPDLGMPLALGDFTGDGVADWITPELLFPSRIVDSRPQYLPSYQNRKQAWTMAEIADFDGNGLVDVVAAAAGSPGLTFFSGTGTKYENTFTLSTQGPVRLLTSGDFNGDDL